MSTSAEPRPSRHRRGGVVAMVAAAVSLLAALAFPFAPVEHSDVTYRWESGPGAGTAVAIPMLPYQPVRLDVSISCAVLAAAPDGADVFSTVPPRTDPRAERLAGLQVSTEGAQAVTVDTGAATLGPVALPPGCAGISVVSTPEATVVSVREGGGAVRELARVDRDVRPAVAGAFTTPAAAAGGVGVEALADTRFQTSITPLKALLGLVAIVGLCVALRACACPLGVLRRRAVSGHGNTRTRPKGTTDLGVIGALGLWQVVGPLSVDDGYIGGIVRERFANGQVGTVFRWLNSPEAPFGWFYDVLATVATVAPAPFWLRLPSAVLGVVAWLLLTRAVLPRLRVPTTRWWSLAAGVVFLAWWLPFGLGVRPEPWVVVGWTVVLVLVERAVARRDVGPVPVALVVAGATLAITPTGLVAFTPLLVAAVPLAHAFRRGRAELGTPLLVLGSAAALAVTLLLVYADQTWASVLDSIGVRRLLGGDQPWSDEYRRWSTLLTEGEAEGSLGRRIPVLLMLVALLVPPLVASGWTGRLRGLAHGPARRVAAGAVAALGVLVLTPTKWTHHFGAFAVVGTAVTLAALRVWWTAVREPHTPAGSATTATRAAVGTVVAGGVVGLGWVGHNQWHWLSNHVVTWSTIAPQVAGIRIADAVGALGIVLGAGFGVVALRRRLRGPEYDAARTGTARTDVRMLAVPPALLLGTAVAVVAVQLLSFAATSVQRRDSYTLAADSLASLTGTSCGIADQLRVEPDPLAGLLPQVASGLAPDRVPPPPPLPTTTRPVPDRPDSPPPTADTSNPVAGGVTPAQPLTTAGTALPGWWGPGVVGPVLALPEPAGGPDARTPLAVTISGPVLGPGDLALEVVDAADGATSRIELDEGSTHYSASATVAAPGARDLRIDRSALPERGTVRPVSGPDTAPAQGFSVPRLPRTVPWSQVLPAGTPAAVDWPAAFLFPCTPLAALRDGTAPLPGWRVSTDARGRAGSGYISYTTAEGGPWAATRMLVHEQDVPVYLPGLPTTDVATLARWVPVEPLGPTPPPERRARTAIGTWSPGPLGVGGG